MIGEELLRAVRVETRRRLYAEVAEVAERASPRRSTADLREIDVLLEDGRKLLLMLKSASATAPVSRPHLVHDPHREPLTYLRVLEGAGLDTPELWGLRLGGGSSLLIERVPGVTLSEARSLDAWRAAARWLARLHSGLTARGRRNARRARLLVAGAEGHRLWLARARDLVDDPRMEPLAAAHPAVVRGLGRLPRAFVHGELYPANVIVEDASHGMRVRVIDWETAGLGPGLMDLAALTSGDWPDPATRRAVAFAYRDEAPDWRGVDDASFMRALDLCAVQVAIGWLGWSAEWSPPAQHAFDWLSSALEAVERLGL